MYSTHSFGTTLQKCLCCKGETRPARLQPSWSALYTFVNQYLSNKAIQHNFHTLQSASSTTRRSASQHQERQIDVRNRRRYFSLSPNIKGNDQESQIHNRPRPPPGRGNSYKPAQQPEPFALSDRTRVNPRVASQHTYRKIATSERPIQRSLGHGSPSRREREQWQLQKDALKSKFSETGWNPRKRLSPDALDGIRALHSQHPELYTTAALADQFQVSPEAIRRILKSKWRPDEAEETERRERWNKRGESIWGQMVELGVHPPKKWRDMGIGRPGPRSARPNGDRHLRFRGGNGELPAMQSNRVLKRGLEVLSEDIELSERLM
ncbi:Required for respiratory growth protein 9 mitochondrial [Agyrium rufum]|nr:Required for respiratory growth protein 9 mitochondrial [Agyrium rufum]